MTLILDDEICPEPFVEPESMVLNRDRDLPLNLQIPLAKFVRKDYLVDRLQETRPQFPVCLNSNLHNPLPDLVFCHYPLFPLRASRLGERMIHTRHKTPTECIRVWVCPWSLRYNRSKWRCWMRPIEISLVAMK